MADLLPNETLYIKNLQGKVKKQEMKRALYALFSAYGRILDIVVCKTPKLRGQAWVVFNEIPAATNALRHLKDFNLFEKPMRGGWSALVLQYAKTKSDAIISLTDDSYAPKEKRRKIEDKGPKKAKEEPQANGSATGHVYGAAPAPAKTGSQDPNNILFLENLPHESTGPMLSHLFNPYPGLKEVRMVEGRPGIAFVEYMDEGQASVAMEALSGFKITANHAMVISYAKK